MLKLRVRLDIPGGRKGATGFAGTSSEEQSRSSSEDSLAVGPARAFRNLVQDYRHVSVPDLQRVIGRAMMGNELVQLGMKRVLEEHPPGEPTPMKLSRQVAELSFGLVGRHAHHRPVTELGCISEPSPVAGRWRAETADMSGDGTVDAWTNRTDRGSVAHDRAVAATEEAGGAI